MSVNQIDMENLEKEFISKFSVWNDKYKIATLNGKEEYPTPEDIAKWWISKIEEGFLSKERVREVCEGMKRFVHKSAGNPPYPAGYNDALSNLLSQLFPPRH